MKNSSQQKWPPYTSCLHFIIPTTTRATRDWAAIMPVAYGIFMEIKKILRLQVKQSVKNTIKLPQTINESKLRNKLVIAKQKDKKCFTRLFINYPIFILIFTISVVLKQWLIDKWKIIHTHWKAVYWWFGTFFKTSPNHETSKATRQRSAHPEMRWLIIAARRHGAYTINRKNN